MALEVGGVSGSGPAFLLGAGIVYEIVASACSSPQTTELNSPARAPTLMKWVGLGLAQGALFVVLSAAWDRANRVPILAGGALAGALMYASYWHARDAGMKSAAPATESYSWGNPT